MTTAFVAGATGYTGSALVRTLAGSGVDTVAHVRPDSPKLNFWHSQFRDAGATLDTTAWTQAAMEQALNTHQPDLVFALLGTTQKRSRAASIQGTDASYEAVDYQLTHILLQACLQSCPQARFIYLSSMGVQASSRSRYMKVRWRMEQELLASGISCTIARPAFITGADRSENRPMERAGATATDMALEFAGLLGFRHTRQRYRSTNATDLAVALHRHATQPAQSQQIVEADALRP
ncbi:MAG: NAD-dependent epimerase/dehydratase family protein [Myxococcota bacterium]|nr:NAD-dependent epimerase/dehydratase family protein [Myxococcota bacterium]